MRILAKSFQMKGALDDDYTLYENGDVLHEYDAHMYPGGQNLKRNLLGKDLKYEVKERLLKSASDEDKELVKSLLEL